MSDAPICDFCTAPQWARRFYCPDVLHDRELGLSIDLEGDWLACSTCGSLIDAENWDALLMRAVDKYSEKWAVPRRILTDALKHSHDLFRQHYRKVQ